MPFSAFGQSGDNSSSWGTWARSSTSADFYKNESMLTGSSTKTEWTSETTTKTNTVTTGTQKTTNTRTASAISSSSASETEAKKSGFQEIATKTRLDIYSAGAKKTDAVWGVGDWGGSNLSVLGYEGMAYGSVSVDSSGASATAGLSGKAYAIRGKINETLGSVGDDVLGAKIKVYVDARVGLEGGISATGKVGKDGVSLSAGANVFAGAKVDGALPMSVTFCYLGGELKIKGALSAGIGGTATATLAVDWANLSVTMSAELAGTLGLGAGAGGEVKVSLGELLNDPGAVADCVLDKLKDLGETALEAGEALVDVASDVIDEGIALAEIGVEIASDVLDEGIALAEKGVEIAADAIDDLASGVSRAADAVGSGVSDVASSIWGFFGGGDSSSASAPSSASARSSGCP
jgi:hypothetical protein